MKRLTTCLAVLSLAFVLGVAGQAFAAKVTIKGGGIQPPEDAASLAMERWSKLVAERTNGDVTIQFFPASQLGDATSMIEAVSMGSQDFFFDAGSFMGTFMPDKNVESVFFLFKDAAHYQRYLDSDIMKDFEGRFEKQQGIKVVAQNYPRQPRSTLATKPIRGLADYAGLKIRVPDIRGYKEGLIGLGAGPVQIAWGEVYLALRQGVVTACEAPLDMAYTMKFFEPAPYLTMTEHIRDNMAIMMNAKKFNSLTKEQQDILTTTAREVGDWYRDFSDEVVQKYIKEMKAAGVEFIQIDTAPLREAVLKRVRELEAPANRPWPQGLYERIGNL